MAYFILSFFFLGLNLETLKWLEHAYDIAVVTLDVWTLLPSKQKRNRHSQWASIPSFLPLIILFLVQLRSSLTWKEWSLSPTKLSLFHINKDQQKNSSSFPNISWYWWNQVTIFMYTLVVYTKFEKPAGLGQFCGYSAK